MKFEKIKGTEEVYAKRIKLAWVKPMMSGELSELEMFEAIQELALKIICDKDGNSLTEDDLYLDDLEPIKNYIFEKMPGGKKKA
jgi:hypothetical protein